MGAKIEMKCYIEMSYMLQFCYNRLFAVLKRKNIIFTLNRMGLSAENS